MRLPRFSVKHEKKNCPKEKPLCIFCKEEHITYHKSYPKFNIQKNVSEIMVLTISGILRQYTQTLKKTTVITK